MLSFLEFIQESRYLSPAIKAGNKVYKGAHTHEDIVNKHGLHGISQQDGFVNHRGHFLDRKKAWDYADKHDLLKPAYKKHDVGNLDSDALKESLSQSRQARQDLTGRKLPDRQEFALNQYSGSHYDAVNKNMRKPSKNNVTKSYADNLAQGVKSAMRPAEGDMNVYRGVRSKKHVGDAKSFSSTSLSPSQAKIFAGEKGHVMKLRVKKGTPVAYTNNANEKEVILPPGKITIKRKSKSDGNTYHHGEYEV